VLKLAVAADQRWLLGGVSLAFITLFVGHQDITVGTDEFKDLFGLHYLLDGEIL